jgi:hypothetical protein
MALISHTKEQDYYVSLWKHKGPVPPILEKSTMEDFEIILQLSANALQSLHDNASSLQFQEILNKEILKVVEEKNKVFDETNINYESRITTLNNNHTIATQELKNKATQEINRLNTKISEVQNKLEQQIQSYQYLNQNFLNLQNSTNENTKITINSIRQDEKIRNSEELNRIEHLYKSQLLEKNNELIKIKDDLKLINEQQQNNAILQQNSSNKGKHGERLFESLVEQYTDWVLDNTSKTTGSGDRHATINDCKVLFEVKYYKDTVKYKEVEKFKNDMDNYNDKSLGVFISHTSRISRGPVEFLYCEINSNNQLLVYIQNFLSFEPEIIFPIINTYIKLAKILHKKNEDSLVDNDLQSRIDSIKPILNDLTKEISNNVLQLRNMKNSLIQKITTDFDVLNNISSKLSDFTKKILNVFFPEETTNSNMILDLNAEPQAKKVKRSTPKIKSQLTNPEIFVDTSIKIEEDL